MVNFSHMNNHINARRKEVNQFPITRGTDLKLQQVKTEFPITMAFDERFEGPRPFGLQLNHDPLVGMVKRDPTDMFKKLGNLAVPNISAGLVNNDYSKLMPIDIDGLGHRFVHGGQSKELKEIFDFIEMMEKGGFDPKGVFTPNLPTKEFAVCPSLIKSGKGIVPINGATEADLTDEIVELLAEACTRIQLDYEVITVMMSTLFGCKVSDVRTGLVEPALNMVDAMIAHKLHKK